MFEAAGWFSRFRAEQHGQCCHCLFVVFALPANIAYPRGEIGNGDQFLAQPREVGDVLLAHDTCRAAPAMDGVVGWRWIFFHDLIGCYGIDENDSGVW